ncbi:secretin receptor-like isoform X2 [Lineus longissimus]|uniref:secretin receptor-like isoform X2 n=1 Tax=Lineus longissimus TaxID=88925 RepID=UPI002B4EB0B3
MLDKLETVYISEETQTNRLHEEASKCLDRIHTEVNPFNGTACNVTWDGVSCWEYTPADSAAIHNCPDYVNKFNPSAFARRTCMEDGEWFVHPRWNRSWTNYTECIMPTDTSDEKYPNISDTMKNHLGRIKLMYNIGYGVSLVSLVTAVIIMLTLKRLRCARNTIHIHLFCSFILRSLMSILKDNLLVEGLGFPSDVTYTSDGDILFLTRGSHWECKFFFTLINYSLTANYAWILVEGLYLYMLLYVTVFSENTSIVSFAILGWGVPLISIIPWVVTRALLDDSLCWNVHRHVPGLFWILKGPIVLSVVINFVFFVSILRVLFSKLVAINAPEARKVRYRKLAKSTLVLIPLFGVHYILFIGLPDDVDETAEIVKLYYEMFFNSFQGFFVALLFCFLNGEVRGEIRKKWQRHNLQRSGLSTTNYTGSMKMSTVSTFTGRNRNSINSLSSEAKRETQQHNGHSQSLLNTNKVSCISNDVTCPITILQDHVVDATNEETNLMLSEDAPDVLNVCSFSEPSPYGETTECISPSRGPITARTANWR